MRVGSARITKADDHNYAVEVYTEVECREKVGNKREKTGKVEYRWIEKGYYGHRLDWAIESAILLNHEQGEVTKQTLREAIREISDNTVNSLKVTK